MRQSLIATPSTLTDSGVSPSPSSRSGSSTVLRVTWSVARTRVAAGSSRKSSATSGTSQAGGR
jgi:hypothetical protein